MGEDDLFGQPADEEDDFAYRDDPLNDEDEGSSSSGCEPDMILQGASVPINVPMGYHRERSSSKKISSSVKVNHILTEITY